MSGLESVNLPEYHELTVRGQRWFLTSVEVWNTMLVIHGAQPVLTNSSDAIVMLNARDEHGTLYAGRSGGTGGGPAGSPGTESYRLVRPAGSNPRGRLTIEGRFRGDTRETITTLEFR